MATVQDIYQQILNRRADPEGLLYWQNQFGNEVDANELAQFTRAAAPEIAQRDAASYAARTPAADIQALYQQNLGRAAEPAGLLYWQNKFGPTVDATEVAEFRAAAAPEISARNTAATNTAAANTAATNTAAANTAATNTAATNTAAANTAATNTAAANTAATNTAATTRTRTAVEDLYQTVLRREGDPTGLAYWQNRFGNEVDANELAQFRAAAANELAAQTVAAGGRTAVQDLYRTELNREGDPAGLAYWQNRFGTEVDANELAIFRAAAAGERTTRGILPGGGAATTTPAATVSTALTGQNQVVAQTNPFANALQGFPSNFQAYQSIPLGSQYSYGRAAPNTSGIVGTATGIGVPALYGQILGRPGETEGVNYWTNKFGPTIDANEITEFQTAAAAELAKQTPASPYQNIMGQSARGFTNPYANYVGGQALGGYDPGLYGRIQTADNAATAAADAAAAAEAARLAALGGGGGDGGDGGDDGGDGGGNGSGAASGDCVDPNVHILLSDRSTVRAGDLKVGDMLHTLHDETFVYGDFPVEYVNILQRPKVEAQFDDGQKIIISITHKFLTADNKWEKISDIEIGTSIRGFGDVTKKLVSITDVGIGPVIEMVVTDAHTYISEGLVSHNKFYGGLITNVSGRDPAGPDDGAVNLDLGEYVIKKSSVKKYGRGLLDMINEGKVPAKKMKSLLG